MLVSIVAASLGGCYQPSVDRDHLEDALEPPTDLFEDGGARPIDARPSSDGSMPIDASTVDAPPGCTDTTPLTALRIVVRTTQFGGQYRPKNIGAIWIQTAAGAYVKTVKRWANRRRQYLITYNGSALGDLTDAISGATLSNHITHDVTWNLTGVNHCEVPTGDYRVWMETTDRDGPGATASFPFTIGATGSVQMPTETTNFHDLLLDLH